MSVRSQTLEEWFTDYQLRAVVRAHVHLPLYLEVDVSRIVNAYAEIGERAPLTAIVVKAAAILAVTRPEVNRAVLRTPIGTRVVQFDQGHVAMPIAIEHDGVRHVTATVVKNADKLSVNAIGAEIKKAQERDIHELPIARRFVKNENTLRHRLALKARHFLAYSVPHFFEKYGAGIGVSSLVRPAVPGVKVRVPPYGPTAFSISPGTIRTEGATSILEIGIGYDHCALPGRDGALCGEELGRILAEGDPALFGPERAADKTHEDSSEPTPAPAKAARKNSKTNGRASARG